ncbi:MAG: PqqD family protein [bacterium]
MLSPDFWEKKFKRAPDCAFREIEGEAFIVSSKTAGVHLLNSVGTFIWNLLDGERTLSEIADALTEEFEVDAATAKSDTFEFIEEILKTEIIEGQ